MSREPTNDVAELVTLDDYRTLAHSVLPAAVCAYIDSGAGDEITCRANREDLDDIALLPLCMRDVSSVDLSLSTLGQSFRVPIGFSPTAFHRLVHSEGEIATARAARSLGLPMIVSSMSSFTLEEIAGGTCNEQLWLQLYLFKDRGLTKELLRRAERAGFKAIVVTLGSPVPGKRDRTIRSRFQLPENVAAANFGRLERVDFNNPIHSIDGAQLDPAATWHDLSWLRENTSLPVVAKGIMNPADVEPAIATGLSAIMVSNHGGRQLDSTASTIRVLPEIVAAVAGRIPVFIDSGFRRGIDVLKALALGADAVFLGRPVLWALAVRGEEGVRDVVALLADELRTAMQLAGCATTAELRRQASRIVRRT